MPAIPVHALDRINWSSDTQPPAGFDCCADEKRKFYLRHSLQITTLSVIRRD